MCGIASIFLESHAPVEEIKQALAAMSHRGPDDVGVWLASDANVVLGHRRLAVRGAPEDSQPILNEARDIAIAVNGEFYDYPETRQWLESRGHIFATTSDSELALHLYEEFGLDFVKKLRGEFALIIWDNTQQRLIAVRDYFGIKPLVYAQSEKGWCVASEAKAIFESGFLKSAWDLESGWHSLAHQYLPPDRTLFRGISSVPPAHMLIIDQRARQSFVQSYWKPHFGDESVSPEAILEMLEDSLSVRLESNIPPAFSLSGGLDSSSIVALAARKLGRPVPAFSVSFTDGAEYNEQDLVTQTARALGADLHIVPVAREDMVTELSDAVYYSEGLAINGQLVAKFRLNRAIREAGHNVVLTGEGADEAFLGYAHFQVDSGQTGVSGAFQRQRGVMLPVEDSVEMLPPSWLSRWPTFMKAKLAFAVQFQTFINHEYEFLPDMRVSRLLDRLDVTGEFQGTSCFVRKSAWLWTRTALAGYILRTLADGTEMAHSVEGRLPFLDHKLFELAAKASVSSNLRDGGAKMLLRRSLHSVLPEPIISRPKHPFLAPQLLAEPCPGVVLDFISDTFRSKSFASIPFFDQKRVIIWFEDLMNKSPQEKRAADPILMTLLSCAMIQQRYRL